MFLLYKIGTLMSRVPVLKSPELCFKLNFPYHKCMQSEHARHIWKILQKLPWQRLLIFGAIFWILVATFEEIADAVLENEPLPGDRATLQWIRHFTSPELTDVMIATTNTGGFVAVFIFTAVASLLLWLYHHRTKAVVLSITIAALAFMNLLLKLLFARPRPELWPNLVETSTYAFPSGHAMLSSALAFTLIALLWNTRWRWAILVIGIIYVLAVGFSRLYLGVHYPTDVIAGWCISGAWVILVLAILRGRKLQIKFNQS